jgi:hypothetical protein
MDICKSCEYENAAFMPCNACDNGSEFKLKDKLSKVGIMFDLMKHPDELEALANALKDVDTCQVWESDAIFEAADVITGLSQIFKANNDSVDPDDIAKQADAYVRDHLLIQYMMWKFGKACMLDIEDIYDEWIKWLEENEN